MAITRYGRYLRELRDKNGEILKDFADKIGVTSAFVSAVENGNKRIPDNWHKKITKLYHLNKKQEKHLRELSAVSKNKIRLDLSNTSDIKRELAGYIALNFDKITDKMAEKALKIFEKNKKK